MTTKTTCPIPPNMTPYQQVHSYAEIEEIMNSNEFYQGGTPERRVFLGDTVLMLDGPLHDERKREFSSLFSKAAMASYEGDLLEPVIAQVLEDLRSHRRADGSVHTDLIPLIRMMLFRISALIVGVDGVDTPEKTERFRKLVEALGEAATAQWSVGDKDAVLRAGKETLRQLVDEFLSPSLDRRRCLVARHEAGEIAREDLPRDVLTLICLNHDDVIPEDDPHYCYTWREAGFFLVASSQTSTHTLPHVLVHIAEWIKEHPEDAAKVNDPSFLRKAVGESLRLHQTSPVKLRVASKDITLSTGRRVAAGEMVALLAPPANLEPEIFGEDADRFNPYRQVAKGQQPWGLTFGKGAHMCCGRWLVTGLFNRTDDKTGTEGTMVKIVRTLYAHGVELDPDNPPKLITATYHDAYESVPIVLRNL